VAASLVVALNEAHYPTAHLFLEKTDQTEFQLEAPEPNVVRTILGGIHHPTPLHAIGTRIVENVFILHIGGHRSMYVVIARGVNGLVSLMELLPKPFSTELTGSILSSSIALSNQQHCTRTVKGDTNSLFPAIQEAIGAVNRGSITHFAAFDLSTLPQPTVIPDSPSAIAVVNPGHVTVVDNATGSQADAPAQECGG